MKKILEFKNFENNYIIDCHKNEDDETIIKLSPVYYYYPDGRFVKIYKDDGLLGKVKSLSSLYGERKRLKEDKKKDVDKIQRLEEISLDIGSQESEIANGILMRDQIVARHFVDAAVSQKMIGILNFIGGERRFKVNYKSLLSKENVAISLIEDSISIKNIDYMKIYHKSADNSKADKNLPLINNTEYYRSHIRELFEANIYVNFLRDILKCKKNSISDFADKMKEWDSFDSGSVKLNLAFIESICDFKNNCLKGNFKGFSDYELEGFFVRYKKGTVEKNIDTVQSFSINRLLFVSYLKEINFYEEKEESFKALRGIFLKDDQTRDYIIPGVLEKIPVGIYTPTFFKPSDEEVESNGLSKSYKTYSIKLNFNVLLEVSSDIAINLHTALTASCGDNSHCWIKFTNHSDF